MGTAEVSNTAFLREGGAMGACMRGFAWHATPLGEPAAWPQSLKTAVSLMLRARQPMFIGWGPQHISLYNDGYIPICGEKHPHALGRPMAQVWSEIWDQLSVLNDAVMRGEAHWYENMAFDLAGRTESGPSYFSFSYTPLLDDRGAIGGIFCSAVETTAAVRLAQRRADEMQRLQRMFEQAPGFICTLGGPQHVFEFVNDAHRRLFQRPEIVGKTMRESFPDIAGQGFYEPLDEVYRTGVGHVAHGMRARLRDTPDAPEREVVLDLVYAPMFDESGRVTGVFCQGQDVTMADAAQQATKEAHEALRRADRQKDDFLATLAHELRNPLAPLRTGLHVLQRGTGTPEEQRVRNIMQRQLDHMVRLVDELLDIARISQGKIVLSRETLQLHLVLQHAVDACRPLLDAQGHTLAWDGVDPQWHVYGDITRLVQVVGNLLNNAAKYTPPGGHVTLHAVEDGQGLAVIVEDDGIGMPKDVLQGVFERFVQVDRQLGRAQGGLGIGLSVVKSIVEMHCGRVSAESAGPGSGSRFLVWLPRTNPPQAEPAGGWRPEASVVAHRMKVLIVDDNRDAAETLCMVVEMGGHEVHLAHDGVSALRIAVAHQPAVVFLDIGMPGMNGYEIASKLRALRGWQHRTLLVALTGWGSEEDRARSLAAGFDVHLTKPVDLREVQRMLSLGGAQPAED
jgi:signal transduction histidine kinase/ActR/RegA family two-component response regulator